MSCTLMYQPYAMSYSSSCERPSASSERQKLFKFPHIPSPPDSSHSGASTYSGHSSPASSTHIPSATLGSGSLSLSAHHSPGGGRSSTSRRPLTPCASSGPSATITSPGGHIQHQSQSQHGHHITLNHSISSSSSNRPSSSNHPNATVTSPQSHNHHHGGSGGGGSGSDLQHHGGNSSASSSAAASSTSTSHIHHESHNNNNQPGPSGSSSGSSGGSGGGGTRAQYLSANCVVYENYDGEAARVVDEHFSRALSAAYVPEKPSKSLTTRNFPPSFWNSAYQPPPKPLTSYGATGVADFYGSAMDYGSALPALAHHHQTDPWHYPLTSHHHHHQPYHHHHRAAELAYPPIASTSRFNPAQYGSFLFPGAAATSAAAAASRFTAMPGSSQCGVKGEGGHWGAGGRFHPHHESTWSDFHLADYSAAAAHYSNMTAGLDFESHYLQSS